MNVLAIFSVAGLAMAAGAAGASVFWTWMLKRAFEQGPEAALKAMFGQWHDIHGKTFSFLPSGEVREVDFVNQEKNR